MSPTRFCLLVILVCSPTFGWLLTPVYSQSKKDSDTVPGSTSDAPEVMPEVMPDLGVLSSGQVQVSLASPVENRWPCDKNGTATFIRNWTSEAFLLTRLPRRYEEGGIRAAWKPACLVRMAADVDLPAGEHRLLLRARALSRLWIDGEVVARTEVLTKSPPDGEEPMTAVPAPIFPGARLPGYRQQEMITSWKKASSSRSRVILELIAGGMIAETKPTRVETGEVLVAIELQGKEFFQLLVPHQSANSLVRLTDAEVDPLVERQLRHIDELDDRERRIAARLRDDYWHKRRQMTAAWLAEHPAPPIPKSKSVPGNDTHPIDAFLQDKIERSVTASIGNQAAEAAAFHRDVLPLLQSQCMRCHGDKANGGLRLNSREGLVAGGDSGSVLPDDASEEGELLRRVRSGDEAERMPPGDKPLGDVQIDLLNRWIKSGAPWYPRPVQPSEVRLAERLDDAAFLRRIWLDTVGLPADSATVREFLSDQSTDKRARMIDRLLDDPRLADHWVSYWQDVLAENPTLINASLNSTGPFRWFLYDALRDNLPVDRWVTELIMMRGDSAEGGSAGFGLAGENDAALATKAQILSSAFMAIEMQCARCHDSPYHSTLQRDLFSMAAFLERKEVKVPKTSSVPPAFFEKKARASLIKVSLEPGAALTAEWPFAEETGCADDQSIAALVDQAEDSRERLAALITAPQNRRFTQVFVNRIWKQLMGAGIVEPVHDWEGKSASHPALLQWLAHDWIAHDYDFKHLLRRIMTSEAYARQPLGNNANQDPESRFFTAPDRRRMTAEQIVDSLYAAAGQSMDLEELTFVHDGRRALGSRLTLGKPKRAWMMANLANERDRPSLTLPRAAMVAEVMEAFGWTGSRQSPIQSRDTSPTAIQPGVLANSHLSLWLMRVSRGSPLAELAASASTPEQLVEELCLRYLGRLPSEIEMKALAAELSIGFDERIDPLFDDSQSHEQPRLPLVTWFNHLQSEANTIQQEHERRVAAGPPIDGRFCAPWRERLEDVVWTLINQREFVWTP